MKVYELIQELCNFDADCEVEIKCELDGVEVELEEEDKKDENTVLVHFEDTSDIDVSSEKYYYGSKKDKVILEAYFS